MHFWVAFLAAGILAYPIWRLLLLTKSRQTISQYAPEGHQVKQGTPTMGGLIVIAGYMVALAASFLVSQPENISYLGSVKPSFIVIAIGFTLISPTGRRHQWSIPLRPFLHARIHPPSPEP